MSKASAVGSAAPLPGCRQVSADRRVCPGLSPTPACYVVLGDPRFVLHGAVFCGETSNGRAHSWWGPAQPSPARCGRPGSGSRRTDDAKSICGSRGVAVMRWSSLRCRRAGARGSSRIRFRFLVNGSLPSAPNHPAVRIWPPASWAAASTVRDGTVNQSPVGASVGDRRIVGVLRERLTSSAR